MARATNKVTGATVSGDETVLRRLGVPWVIDGDDKPKATRKAPAKKSSDEKN